MDNYAQILVEEIHSVVIATLDNENRPQTRVIDMMLEKDNKIYFLTANTKEFYNQLLKDKYITLTGLTLTGLKGDSLNKISISLKGKIRSVGTQYLDEIFEKNSYMKKIYPTKESMKILEVFEIYDYEGEFFDLRVQPPFIKTFNYSE